MKQNENEKIDKYHVYCLVLAAQRPRVEGAVGIWTYVTTYMKPIIASKYCKFCYIVK